MKTYIHIIFSRLYIKITIFEFGFFEGMAIGLLGIQRNILRSRYVYFFHLDTRVYSSRILERNSTEVR